MGSSLGGASLEKRAILFNSAKLRKTNITQNAANSDNANFFKMMTSSEYNMVSIFHNLN